MKIKIKVYAALKMYFEPEFELNEPVLSIADLKDKLTKLNPESVRLINLSRFAVNNTFINTGYQFYGNENISIIPPSSGG